MLTRIFVLMGKEAKIKIKNFLGEEFHNLYFSPIIITVIKSRKIKFAGHKSPKAKMRNAMPNLVGIYEFKKCKCKCN